MDLLVSFNFVIALIVITAAVGILHSIASEILHINRVASLSAEVRSLQDDYLTRLRSQMGDDNDDGEVIEVEEVVD